MSENTKIEWADHTFNPWEGCQKVGPGCDHCYAETRNARFGGGQTVNWGPGAPRRRTSAANWRKPLQWNACHEAFFAEHGLRQRVFCASLADVFDNAVSAQWRFDLLRLIVETPNLDWLLLTKRISNAAEMLEQAMRALTIGREGWRDNNLPNVWLGVTICNQEEADRDIPKLLAVPARVRFLSMEPLLGPVRLQPCWLEGEWEQGAFPSLDWVIVGGESGPGARPMHPDWARGLRDQCAAAGVPFLFKQWGEYLPWTHFNSARIDDPPEQKRFSTMERRGEHWEDVGYPMWCDSADGAIDDMQCLGRVGKKAAGRLLDGVQHDGFPTSNPPQEGNI